LRRAPTLQGGHPPQNPGIAAAEKKPMTTVTTILAGDARALAAAAGTEQSTSAVSWPAVFAGAVAAAALSLVLLVLGVGLGLSVASPWTASDPTAEALSGSTILWIFFTAFAASGVGGYMAGRLRTRWPGTQLDEVYFRDTAHGFLAWGVATLLTAAALTGTIGAILGTPGGESVESAVAEITDAQRRNAAKASLWLFASLLVGAFTASWLATYGGRRRDLP
jgi:hypothetical protein